MYPLIDGVPIVLRDVDAWLAQEAVGVLAREDLPAPVLERVVSGAGGALQRDRRLLEVYLASREGPLQDWARAQVAALRGFVLDMGAGAGMYGALPTEADLVGLDLNWTMLRRFPGRRVLADAHDPPFHAEQFDAVLLFNLLDSCREPFLVLQQADALLATGGTLILSCAFAWQDEITPRPQRLEEGFLLHFLRARGYVFEPGSPLDLDWPLQLSARTRHVHRTLALRARKNPVGASAAAR